MKKKTIIYISIAVLLVTFILIFLSNSSLFKKKSLEETYKDVFNGSKFILNGKSKKISDFIDGDNAYIDYYSFVDYENDNHNEMFVKIGGPNSKDLIFNFIGNKMYAYELEENVYFNSVDGYSFHNGLSEGWVKYSFKKNKLNKEVVLIIDEKNDKCSYKSESVDCSDIITKEIELLKEIGKKAEEIKLESKDKE